MDSLYNINCNSPESFQFKLKTSKFISDLNYNPAYSVSSIINRINDPALKYDIEELVGVMTETTLLFKEDAPSLNESDFKSLIDRLDQGSLTYHEFAGFLEWNSIPLEAVKENLASYTNRSTKIYPQLNYYLDQNMSAAISGNFCSIFLDIIDMIAQVRALMGKGEELISKFLPGGIDSQISNIQDMIFRLIDGLKDKMLERLFNLKNSILTGNLGALAVVIDKYEGTRNGYSDDIIQNLKDRIEEFIKDISQGYEEMTPEVIAYLLYRFCILIQNIENLFTSPVEAFSEFTSRFQHQKDLLTNVSNSNTSRAVGMGFYRMDRAARDQGRIYIANQGNRTGSNSSGQYNASYNAPRGNTIKRDVSDDELSLIMSAYNPGGNRYIEWAPQVLKMGTDVSDAVEGDGWRKVRQTILLVGIRCAQEMGVRLLINSAYRSPQYNSKIGGVGRSRHMSGTALDISYSSLGGRSGAERLVSIAYREQIRWHHFYNTFVHIDVGENTNLDVNHLTTGFLT